YRRITNWRPEMPDWPPGSPGLRARRASKIRLLPARRPRLDSVKRRILFPQIVQKRLMTQGLAGHFLTEIGGAIALAGTVNLFIKPALETLKFAAAEVG